MLTLLAFLALARSWHVAAFARAEPAKTRHAKPFYASSTSLYTRRLCHGASAPRRGSRIRLV
jgi:hypothetical protein